MRELTLTIVLALIAVFALQWGRSRDRRVYLESKLEYCQRLVVAYWTNDPAEIKYAEKLWFYGCTRTDD